MHRLEKNDFSSSAGITTALRDALQKNEMVHSDEKSNKSPLHFLLKHFVLESLGTSVVDPAIDECVVSIGVITGSHFLAVSPFTAKAVSRKRFNSKAPVYCWFIPFTSVQDRVCLLTLLSVEKLQSMRSSEVVKAIERGDLGYYSFPRLELRRIANILDAHVLLGQNDCFVLRRPESSKENHTVVLFSQVSPEFALSQLHVYWKVGFYCDQTTYNEIVTPALADIAAIREKKLWENADFVLEDDDPNQLYVVDLDYMVKCGTVESHLHQLIVAMLFSVVPHVLLFDSANRREVRCRNCCDNFVCAKMDKKNLVYYILVHIVNILSNFRRDEL